MIHRGLAPRLAGIDRWNEGRAGAAHANRRRTASVGGARGAGRPGDCVCSGHPDTVSSKKIAG